MEDVRVCVCYLLLFPNEVKDMSWAKEEDTNSVCKHEDFIFRMIYANLDIGLYILQCHYKSKYKQDFKRMSNLELFIKIVSI